MRLWKSARLATWAALLAGLVFGGSCAGGTHPAARVEPPREEKADGILAQTRAFEFHGSFWTDLHHFLYVVARGRLKTPDAAREAVVEAPEELEKAGLSASERAAMDSAIAVYMKSFARRDLVFDDGAAAQTAAIARLESRPAAAGAEGVDPELTSALDLAAPLWRKAFWPRHSRRHRAWLDEVLPILAKHSDAMVRGIENAYGVRWPPEPLRVDLVAYANWAGAYTNATRPPRTTMSTTDPTYGGAGSLEMLFHEASHTFDQIIMKLLADEGRRQERRIPRRLSHALVFDTAGELAAARIPGYVPAGEKGLYRKGEWFREPLTRIWHPHIAGRVPLAVAVRDLVAEVGER